MSGTEFQKIVKVVYISIQEQRFSYFNLNPNTLLEKLF